MKRGHWQRCRQEIRVRGGSSAPWLVMVEKSESRMENLAALERRVRRASAMKPFWPVHAA